MLCNMKMSFFLLLLSLFSFLLTVNAITSSNSPVNHKADTQISIPQKILKIKQLLSIIQDPSIRTFLKLNNQTLKQDHQNPNSLQTFLTKEQMEILVQAKNSLNQWEQCPSKYPFYDGLTCISCKNLEIFDFSTSRCALCRSGMIFDKKNKVCVSKSSMINLALTEMDLQKAQEIIIIRANHIVASLMSFVHEKTQRLKIRLTLEDFLQVEGQNNNKTSLTPNVTNPHFLNLMILKNDQKMSEFIPTVDDIPCPKQLPFFSRDKCVSCNYPTHLFDATTKWCVKCSNEFVYSVKTHQCMKIPAIKE